MRLNLTRSSASSPRSERLGRLKRLFVLRVLTLVRANGSWVRQNCPQISRVKEPTRQVARCFVHVLGLQIDLWSLTGRARIGGSGKLNTLFRTFPLDSFTTSALAWLIEDEGQMQGGIYPARFA